MDIKKGSWSGLLVWSDHLDNTSLRDTMTLALQQQAIAYYQQVIERSLGVQFPESKSELDVEYEQWI